MIKSVLCHLKLLVIFSSALLSVNNAFSSDLRWDTVYQVPDDEIWRITWKNPYDNQEVRPIYDLKILSGSYRIPNFNWVQVIKKESNNEIHFIATSDEHIANIEISGGASFKVANDLLDFKVKPLAKPSLKQRGAGILNATGISDFVLIGSVILNGLIGLLIGRYIGRPLLGLGLGLPLGPIGWVIILLVHVSPKKKTQPSNDPQNPTTSFESYKSEQQKTRPGFSHMTTKEQKQEWIDYLDKQKLEEISKTDLPTVKEKSDNEVPFQQKEASVLTKPYANKKETKPELTIDKRLQKIKQLLEDGLISEEEASTRRSKILEEI
jgi:hypothetical protein